MTFPLPPADPEVLADREEELRALLEPDEQEAEPTTLEPDDLPF